MAGKSNVQMFNHSTWIDIKNNGTGTAHNIRIVIAFGAGGPQLTEFVPELAPDTWLYLSIPMGSDDLPYSLDRFLFIAIECNELVTATTFEIGPY